MAGDDSGAGEENLGVEFAMLDEALNELFGRSRRTAAELAEIFMRLEQLRIEIRLHQEKLWIRTGDLRTVTPPQQAALDPTQSLDTASEAA